MSREISNLIARLEAATGPDMELDARIWCLLESVRYISHNPAYGKENRTQVVFREKGKRTDLVTNGVWRKHAEPVTASIDAAVALAERVLPGWRNSSIKTNENEYAGYVWQRGDIRCHEFSSEGVRSSRAIALLIAILKAKEASDEA